MHFRPIVVFVLLGLVLIHNSEGLFIKEKIIAAKKPLLLAKAAVAKEIALTTKVAAIKTAAAAKATAIAAKTVALAPLKVAKKKIAIKVAALKAAKALKVAAVSKLLQGAASKVTTTNVVVPAVGVAVLPIHNVAAVDLSLVSRPVYHPTAELSLPVKPSLTESISQGISGIASSIQNLASNSKPSVTASLSGQQVLSVRPVYEYVPHVQLSQSPTVQLNVLPQNTVHITHPHETYGVPPI